MKFLELTNEQRRQLIDAQQLYASWRPAHNELARHGSLIWQTSRGKRYLCEQHQKVRKSLGRETPALRDKKEKHDAKRKALTATVRGSKKRLDQMAPVNRALKLGRIPTIAANILRELDREDLLGSHIIVAGTNALYAYEAATGTVLDSQHVATTDADLLWDSNQSLLLATTGVPREGLLGILRRADKSFKADYGLNPTNDDGYVVDLLCAETENFQTMKVGADIEATQMPGVQWLLQHHRLKLRSSPKTDTCSYRRQSHARLHCMFAVSQRKDRQPLKRPRDATHAKVVAELVRQYLRDPWTVKDMPWLPKELKALLKDLKPSKRT
jgi:hypothetical protein